MNKKKTIEIFYFKAGGGHISAMNALKEVLAEKYPAWSTKAVDLAEILKPIDPVYKTTRLLSEAPAFTSSQKKRIRTPTIKTRQSQDVYNFFLQHDMTRGFGALLPLMQRYIRIPRQATRMKALLTEHWHKNGKPDLVVSVVPNFNAIMFGALKENYPAVPYVTIMTDMVDLAPHFWMEKQDQYIICGSSMAFEQAIASGFYSRDKIFSVSGMILNKSFYEAPKGDGLTHRDLGLSSDLPTILIMFGGNGSSVSQKIVRRLNKAGLRVQTIVLCGHNQKLYQSLRGMPACHAVGFVANVADYMRLADIFIGKPGPGSISEAIHMGCPVILERNESTMPQESPNVDWVLERGLGYVVKDFDKGSEIADAVKHMLSDLTTYKKNIEKIPVNRAVYEIAILLNQIVRAASITAGPADEDVPSALGSRFAYPR